MQAFQSVTVFTLPPDNKEVAIDIENGLDYNFHYISPFFFLKTRDFLFI